ncbi:MAG: diaminopimelate decarboxylase [Proteocatella sp.]
MRNARYMGINEKGNMTFGGADTVELAKTYGTPLYVMDEVEIRTRCKELKKALTNKYENSKILYASKVFSCKEIYRILAQEGMGVDVVSAGEFYTALQAGFPAKDIYFHGNNKTMEELEYAIENNIGYIVIDNFYEMENVQIIAKEKGKAVNALLRISPGIEGHTHEAISTGQLDSKFGFPMEFGIAIEAVGKVLEMKNIVFKGIHCHIGSQMFLPEIYKAGAEKMTDLALDIKTKYAVEIEQLNIGGGFGVYYTESDSPQDISVFMDTIIGNISSNCEQKGLKLPMILIEPGRWLAGEAGITLYTLGAIKDIPGVRKYISVDGGMTDNIRPALYDAKYEGVVANKAGVPATEKVTIAGKCCESGDKLIIDLMVPHIEPGDILAVLTTGAYNYSMASNYNRLKKPAVVMVNNGESRVIVKRETLEDLVRNDI